MFLKEMFLIEMFLIEMFLNRDFPNRDVPNMNVPNRDVPNHKTVTLWNGRTIPPKGNVNVITSDTQMIWVACPIHNNTLKSFVK